MPEGGSEPTRLAPGGDADFSQAAPRPTTLAARTPELHDNI